MCVHVCGGVYVQVHMCVRPEDNHNTVYLVFETEPLTGLELAKLD